MVYFPDSRFLFNSLSYFVNLWLFYHYFFQLYPSLCFHSRLDIFQSGFWSPRTDRLPSHFRAWKMTEDDGALI